MTQRPRNRGCFNHFKFFWNIIFSVILLVLIGFNIVFSNILGETCGFIHPWIFEVEASVVDDEGRSSSVEYTRFPFNATDIQLFFDFEEQYSEDTGESTNNITVPIDPYLRIYDASGDTLLAENDDDPRNETFNSAIRNFGLDQSAEIIIEVATFADRWEGGYTLRVEQIDGAPNPIETGRAERIATVYDPEIELNNTGDIIDDFIFSDERVVYTMQVEANQAYNVFLEANEEISFIDENELDTYLRVYNETTTTVLAENDDESVSSFGSTIFDFGVDETQTVVIEISTFMDAMVGEYTLLVIPVDGDYASNPTDAETVAVAIVNSVTAFDTEGGIAEGAINQDERIRYQFTAQAGQAYEISVSGFNAFSDEIPLDTTIPRAQEVSLANAFSNSPNAASEWARCLQYFGYVDDGNYVLNQNGLIWFLVGTEAEEKLFNTCAESTIPREFLEQCVRSSIRLSSEGRMFFFVLLSILVVSLPIFIVDALEGQRELVWYIFLMIVVVQATTTAMLFLHLGQVSGIAALEEFGYGIFGGIATGAALVFIDKVASRASDGSSGILSD